MSAWSRPERGGPSGPEAEPVDRNDPPPQWTSWRQAAQSVTRAWNEWSAASGRDRAELYARYASAIAAEERAATALEHEVKLGERS